MVRAQRLRKGYQDGQQKVHVLQGVDVSLRAGESLGVLGHSGSGKSTLLHCLAGLDSLDGGRVELMGLDLNAQTAKERARLRNQHLGFVFQFHHLLPEFTALENVMMPLLIGKVPAQEARERAVEGLQDCGLSQRLEHKPAELSGGERQRVAIARALVVKPAVLLADEPTGNLDKATAQQVFSLLLERVASSRCCLVMATHDEYLARQLQRCRRLEQGRLNVLEMTGTASV